MKTKEQLEKEIEELERDEVGVTNNKLLWSLINERKIKEAKLQQYLENVKMFEQLKLEIRKDSEYIDGAEMVSVNCVFAQIDKILNIPQEKGEGK